MKDCHANLSVGLTAPKRFLAFVLHAATPSSHHNFHVAWSPVLRGMGIFPENWRDLARRTDALKGLRQDKSEENLLRTLLIHLACGCSLRETAIRARKARLAELSDVAVLKRLRKSQTGFMRYAANCLGNEE